MANDDNAERELTDLGERLQAAGWAPHRAATSLVEWLLSGWEQLAAEAGAYRATIDDYTNDLTGRDAVELVLGRASEPLRAKLQHRTTVADDRFRATTVDDVRGVVGRFHRLDDDSGWWWHRIPQSGALADYIAQVT